MADSRAAGRSDSDDGDEVVQAGEVVGVAGAQRQLGRRRARSAPSVAAWGPAASSANVIDVTAISRGNAPGSMSSRSMTTDVSRIPRARRCSGTRFDARIGDRVEVDSESFGVDHRRTVEQVGNRFGTDKALPAERAQLTDRLAGAGDDEGLASVEPAHDLAAGVAELSLRDRGRHDPYRSTSCYAID